MDPNSPPLLRLVTDWWLSSEFTDRFVLIENRFSCKCCNIIFMKVASDRVFWGLYIRGHENFEKHEISAANPELFEVMADVFRKANHG